MVRRKGMAGLALCFATSAFLFALSGCFIIGERHQLDEPLPGDSLQTVIQRGITTKQEILERFGPPLAVARRGTTMVYPPPGPAKRGRIDIQSDAFFELFSADRALRDSEIVYYYDSSCTKALGVLVIPIMGGGYYSRRVAAERLWVLMDEINGIVEDYVYRDDD